MKLHRPRISYNAAWRMRHKLMQVMMEGRGSAETMPTSAVSAAGASAGAARRKTPFVAAVETNAEGPVAREAHRGRASDSPKSPPGRSST